MPGCELRGFSNLLLAVTSTGSDQEDRLRKSGQLECNSSSYCLSHCLAHSLTHTHTHTHIHTHTHTHTSTHTHLYTHTLTHRQTHTPLAHSHTHTHTHTLYTHTLTHRQTHTPLHTHIHTHTHTQTDRHTHTHTHTHTLPSLSPKHNSSTVIHATSKALPAHFLFTEHSRHSHGAKALSVHVAIQSRLDGHTLNQQQAPLFLCSSAYSTRL